MSRRVLIAGSGKMARDIGAWLLGHGESVTFVSRDSGRLEQLRLHMTRVSRRIARAGMAVTPPAFGLIAEQGGAAADCLIESTSESLEQKRCVVEALAGAAALVLSNSSSILPDQIHARCLGLHFFYPVQLNGVVELVVPRERSGDAPAALSLCAAWGLQAIEESGASAFAVNRLLLPLQAEALRLLMAGVPADAVERTSHTRLTPFGQLSFMDGVGLHVVLPAVRNYLGRMPGHEQVPYRPLVDGLEQLLACKRERLLGEGPLPWPPGATVPADLAQRFADLARGSVDSALAAGLLSRGQLELAVTAVFGGRLS